MKHGKTHDGRNHAGKTYGTISSTRTALHRAERRTAGEEIAEHLDGYTGIFQTKDETQARRVLTIRRVPWTDEPVELRFAYMHGWYLVLVPEILSEDTAAALNNHAHTIANTNIKPPALQTFKEYEL